MEFGNTGSPNSRRGSKRFSWRSWRIRRVSTKTTSGLVSGCQWSDKWLLVHVRKLHIPPSLWTQSSTLLAERRIIPYSTEIHWRLQNYAYKLGCYAWRPHRWLLEYRWVKRFVWFLDRFHSVYSIGRETSRRIHVVRVETDKNGKRHPDQIIDGQNSGEECQRTPSWRRGKNGQLKSQSSIMQEDYEESISLTLRTWNSKKPLRMHERNWQHQCPPLCLARQARKARTVRPVARPMISSQNLRVSWKPMNPDDCVWKKLYRNIMSTISQEEVTLSKSSSGQGMGETWKDSAWDKTSRKQIWRDRWSKDEGRKKVQFASLMDICHLKNAELETKHQKYKGRVVLRGDIVKDDSGSYAVFTEQGSPASQMTAAKVMDIISRLPGCSGQAADAVSACTQEKWRMLPNYWKIQKSECPDTWIRLPRRKWPKSWSSMEDPVVPVQRNLYGQPLARLLWERQLEKILLKHGWEKIPNWECLFVHREKGLFLSVYVDDTKLERNKTLIRCGKYPIKKLPWESRHHALIMYTWCVLRDNVK